MNANFISYSNPKLEFAREIWCNADFLATVTEKNGLRVKSGVLQTF